MKLTKRNKVRLVIAATISSILLTVVFIPILILPLVVIGLAVALVEPIRYVLEELFGYDFDDE